MASKPKIDPNLTNAQQKKLTSMQKATDSVIRYSAAKIPPLSQGEDGTALLEELGPVNQAKKDIEKVEKILKERLKSVLDGKEELRADNYSMTNKGQDRTALNQGAAKDFFQQLDCFDPEKLSAWLLSHKDLVPTECLASTDGNFGMMESFLQTTEVVTMRISEL